MTLLIKHEISQAAEIIRAGGLVAVPTETVYGLAGNGLDSEAVDRIYTVKGRPSVKPLSLMISGVEDIEKYCTDVPEDALALARKFWPGPLTIVLNASPVVPDIVRAGGKTVGLRCPNHKLTLALIKACSLPLAAPSANPSAQPSPKDAQKVMEYFDGVIDAVIDGGRCGIGMESTIIDMSRCPYRILRQGALDEKRIVSCLTDNMTVIGITGPTGCGKTTALDVLSDFGALILDCDKIYHDLLERDISLLEELSVRFPGTVTASGLDRKRLAKIVFSDEKALEDLNKISHAHISDEIQRRISDFAMAGGNIVGIDAIELISSGLSGICDHVIAVLSDKENRVRRITARDNISEEAALMRIEAQKEDEYFIDNCGYILYNNGTREEFRDSIFNLLTEVL